MTGLSRRQFLAAGAGVTLAGLTSGCASPIVTSFTGGQPATADVIFWHLFGGGDGANMATMVDSFRKSSGTSVEATLLSWGNPFYTKLSLSASSGRPPDVAVAHLSRLPLLAEAGLLEPVSDQFSPLLERLESHEQKVLSFDQKERSNADPSASSSAPP